MVTFCSHCGADLSHQPSGAIFGRWDNRCPDCGLDVEERQAVLVETPDEVVYDLHDWEPGERVGLSLSLRDRDVAMRWEPGHVLVVREQDVAAVEEALDEGDADEDEGGADTEDGDAAEDDTDNDEYDEDEDEDEEDVDEDVQAAMGDLFVAADRLLHDPTDGQVLTEVGRLATLVEAARPPFGVDRRAWKEIGLLARGLLAAAGEPEDEDVNDDDEEDEGEGTEVVEGVEVDEAGGPEVGVEDDGDGDGDENEEWDEGGVVDAARALRDYLRPMV